MGDQTDDFIKFYDSRVGPIYRYCFFRVYSKQVAEDLTQDAFLKLWDYIQKGNEVKNMKALLYRISTHLIIDYKRRRKELSLDTILEDSDANEPQYDNHQTIEQDILFKQVLTELKTLSDNEQEIIILRYVNDLDPKDMAEILGTTANNISVKLNTGPALKMQVQTALQRSLRDSLVGVLESPTPTHNVASGAVRCGVAVTEDVVSNYFDVIETFAHEAIIASPVQ